jgi:hypothetical protein
MILLCLSSEEYYYMRLCVLGIFVVGERELQKWVAQNFLILGNDVGSLAVGQSPHGSLVSCISSDGYVDLVFDLKKVVYFLTQC